LEGGASSFGAKHYYYFENPTATHPCSYGSKGGEEEIIILLRRRPSLPEGGLLFIDSELNINNIINIILAAY